MPADSLLSRAGSSTTGPPARRRGSSVAAGPAGSAGGDLAPGLAPGSARYRDPEQSFLARTEPLLWSGCLIWTGATGAGYGQLRVNGRMMNAHRYAWEREYGPIPDGMVVDHRYHCSTLCCEVTHLRVVSNAANVAHRAGANRNSRTGVRGVHPRRGGFQVMARVGGIRRGGWHRTIEDAAAEAAEIYRKVAR